MNVATKLSLPVTPYGLSIVALQTTRHEANALEPVVHARIKRLGRVEWFVAIGAPHVSERVTIDVGKGLEKRFRMSAGKSTCGGFAVDVV